MVAMEAMAAEEVVMATCVIPMEAEAEEATEWEAE